MHWKPDPLLYPPFLRSRIKRRRGVGVGQSYVPWLKHRDVGSIGTSGVIKGVLSDRPHHLLSELEVIYFYLLERRASTLDIREQWPILDIDRTLELCAQFGVHHGTRRRFPEPFTIDFLISERVNGEIKHRAASVKSPEDALDPNVRLRLAVEHAWCRDRGIPWTLVNTTRFDKTLLENLRFMRAWFRHRYVPDAVLECQLVDQFHAVYAPNRPLRDMLAQLSGQLRKPAAVIEDSFRYCIWTERLPLSLSHPIALNNPVVMRTDQSHA